LVTSKGKNAQAVFLDRDGVINASVVVDGRPYPPATLEELEILPKVKETLEAFRDAGLKVIVVTNQPDVATGKQSLEIVEEIHNFLLGNFAIDEIKACYCVEGEDCPCYKPKPKMILDAAEEWGVNLARSFMIGDRWRDVGAGQASNCTTFFIDYGYDEKQPDKPDYKVASLTEAAQIILTDLLNDRK